MFHDIMKTMENEREKKKHTKQANVIMTTSALNHRHVSLESVQGRIAWKEIDVILR